MIKGNSLIKSKRKDRDASKSRLPEIRPDKGKENGSCNVTAIEIVRDTCGDVVFWERDEHRNCAVNPFLGRLARISNINARALLD